MKGWATGLAAVALGITLCAAPPLAFGESSDEGDPADHDPIEHVNRKIFWFNDEVDVHVLAPVARGWEFITPRRLRTSVHNFFTNLRFPVVAVNDLLQGKVKATAVDVGRFGVNTTVGVAGFFDPASGWGLEEHNEDFGQTLGVWGVPPGPYLVLPIFGPSNPRDALGLGVDYALSVTPFFVDQYILWGTSVLNVVNERAAILKEVDEAKQSALDYYVFVRNAYFQRRKALIEDRTDFTTEEEQDLYHPKLEQQ